MHYEIMNSFLLLISVYFSLFFNSKEFVIISLSFICTDLSKIYVFKTYAILLLRTKIAY